MHSTIHRDTIKLSEKTATAEDVRTVVTEFTLADETDEAALDNEFEVCKVGKFADWRYGVLDLTEEMLNELVKHFNSKILETDVALDADHMSHKGALAWIESMRVKKGILLAKFRDWSEEGKEALFERKFKYFSIEFGPRTKVKDDGTKVITPNVLMGIGMTNRPVVKGLEPTFLSESIQKELGNSNQPGKPEDHMQVKELIMKFGSSLVKADAVTAADHKRFSDMLGELPKEDHDEDLTKLSSNVEAKAKETAEAEAKKLSDAKTAEKDRKLSEDEKDAKLKELSGKVGGFEERETARILTENIAAVTLSDKVNTGFPAASAEKVKTFLSALNAEQVIEFTALLGEVKTTDKAVLIELGEKGSGKKGDASNMDTKLAEAQKTAEKLVKDESISLSDALTKVYKDMGLTDEGETE